MGDIFQAECPCGFKSRELYVGGGMKDSTLDGVPVACPQCHVVWVEDVKSGKRTCRKCKSALYYLHEDGNFAPAHLLKWLKVEYPWDVYSTEREVKSMPKVFYRCPNCGKLEMQLVDVGCWD